MVNSSICCRPSFFERANGRRNAKKTLVSFPFEYGQIIHLFFFFFPFYVFSSMFEAQILGEISRLKPEEEI